MNKRPYYTFRVSIRKDEQDTIIDTAISGSTPAEIKKAKADVIRLIDSYTPEGLQAAPAPAPVALQPGTTLDLDPESQAPIDPTASPEWKNPADRLNTDKAEVEIRPTATANPVTPGMRPPFRHLHQGTYGRRRMQVRPQHQPGQHRPLHLHLPLLRTDPLRMDQPGGPGHYTSLRLRE